MGVYLMTNRRVGVALGLVTAVLFYAVATATIGNTAVTPSGFSGYATGTNVHVDALQADADGPRIVDTEVAFSAGVVNSNGLATDAPPVNEMNVSLYPEDETDADPSDPGVVAGDKAVARGSGLEVGVANSVPTTARQLVLAGEADATAPPPEEETREITTGEELQPLAYASLLRGYAQANYPEDDNPCSADPLAEGLGYAADAQLLDAAQTTGPDGRLTAPVLSTDAPNEERAVSQSRSLVYPIANGDGTFGLTSEVRETFAPITIDRGTPLPVNAGAGLVIELLGEWVFKATATGIEGDPRNGVTLGVEDTDGQPFLPEQTIIRVSQDGGATYTKVLSFQDVFGAQGDPGGLVIPVTPLVTLAIAEDPRAISDPNAVPDPEAPPTESATSSSGAADAVRLQVLFGDPVPAGSHAADLRIGHFEAAANVPAGGFRCGTTTTEPPTTTPTTDPAVTTTTTAPQGYVEICNETDNRYGSISGQFRYFFNGRSITIPANTCSAPMRVPSGWTAVRQQPRDNIAMTGCEVDPADRMRVCDPEGNRIVARVAPGGVANETVVTFINRRAEANTGSIKVCKVAGNGVKQGTEFTFNVGGRTAVVPAGPASQGGYCKILGGYEQGQNVTITEQAKSGTRVTNIQVEPAGRKVSSNNANRTTTVKPGPGYTVVTYTNAAS